MPRHTFTYSTEFLDELRKEINNVFDNLEPERFGQESQYTSGILAGLGRIRVKSLTGEYAIIKVTNIDDRGRDSAESRYGADFAITATVGDSKKTVRKVILVQVKNKPIDTLPKSQLKGLKEQINKMKKVVNAPKVVGIRREDGRGMFEISSANKIINDEEFKKLDFPQYFNQRVITTLDGCTNISIVNAIEESNLRKLDVLVKNDNPSKESK